MSRSLPTLTSSLEASHSQHHPHHQPHPPHPHPLLQPLQQQHQPLTAAAAAESIAAVVGPPAMTFSIYAIIVLLLTLLIITANVLILLVLLKTDMLALMNRYFLLSLTVSDLCVGLFIAPFSFWTALFDRWIYGEEFCHVEAYMAAIFWIASVYSLTWLSIDHYVAIRKPDRYESIMTRTRCVCWVALIWIGATSFCCPPIFGISRAHYIPEAYVCLIDWNLQKAYFATSGLLVIAPPLTALTVANMYVFTDKYQQNKLVYEQCTEINSRPDMYVMNVVIGGVYVISWIPLCSLQIYEAIRSNGQSAALSSSSSFSASSSSSSSSSASSYSSAGPAQVHFWLVWLAIGNSFWKFPVYVLCSHDFRTGLRMLYARSTCSPCCC